MEYQGIIFDFNGTLFFDNDKHVKAWNEISKQQKKIRKNILKKKKNIIANSAKKIKTVFIWSMVYVNSLII